MATETKTRETPAYVENVMKAATDAGLEVVRNTNSIKISVKGGKRNQTFSIPRNPYPTAPQLRTNIAKHGFLAQVKYDPESKSETAKAEANEHLLTCPDCVKEKKEPPFTTPHPQGLGSHRRRAHGVEGTHTRSIQKRAVKKPTPAKKTAAPKTPPKQETPAAPVPAQPAAPAAETDARPQIMAVDGTPSATSLALAQLISAVHKDRQATAELRTENERLRAFKDKVTAEATNGNQTPIQTVANIEALCRAADQQ
jgi:hypothetical protein